MKAAARFKPRACAGITLIELLVVIAIIGVLAGLMLPTINSGGDRRPIRAIFEMHELVTAIEQYEATYGHFPISKQAADSLSTNCPDFTFGTMNLDTSSGAQTKTLLKDSKTGRPLPPVTTPNGDGYQNSNAEIMGILLDRTNYANGQPTVNANHQYNPKHIVFFYAKEVSDNVSPGLGADGVYRDPWGMPYIITLDVNDDGKCRDAFYRLAAVSQTAARSPSGYNNLVNTVDAAGNGDHYEANTEVMVWSFGPDRKIDVRRNAVSGANKDNLLSWH